MQRPARKPITLDEIDALEDATGQRYELWHGEPVAMTGGTLKHNLIALGLCRAIYPRLPSGCRVVVADVDRGAWPLPAAPRGVRRCAGGLGLLNPGRTRP